MRFADICLAISVAAFWGGNLLAAKIGVGYFPPFFFTGLRFVCVACLVLPFVKVPTLPQMKRILPVAILASGHFSLLFVSLHRGLDVSTGSLIGQLGVPFSCILGALFLQDKIGLWRSSGIVIAFIGVAVISGTPNILAHPDAFFISVSSAFSWAVANILVKRVSDLGNMQLVGWMAIFIFPILLTISLCIEPNGWAMLAEAPLPSLFALTYTTIASTIGAYGIWYYLLAKYPVSQVTPYSLLTPVFGIACGHWYFNEALTWDILLGGAITIFGVAIIVMRKPKHALLTEAT